MKLKLFNATAHLRPAICRQCRRDGSNYAVPTHFRVVLLDGMASQVPVLEPQTLLEDPTGLVKSSPQGARPYLEQLELQIRYRRALELRLNSRLQGLESKVSDLESALETLEFLHTDNTGELQLLGELETRFELCDGVYARAVIDRQSLKTVFLWLGAKTMVEFSCEEAKALLERNLDLARKSVRELKEQLNTVRSEIVTAEVNMSRLYNAEVELRRK
jgi:prefoldin subunit 5